MLEKNIKIILDDLYSHHSITKEEVIKQNIQKRLNKSLKAYIEELSKIYENINLDLKTVLKGMIK